MHITDRAPEENAVHVTQPRAQDFSAGTKRHEPTNRLATEVCSACRSCHDDDVWVGPVDAVGSELLIVS